VVHEIYKQDEMNQDVDIYEPIKKEYFAFNKNLVAIDVDVATKTVYFYKRANNIYGNSIKNSDPITIRKIFGPG